MAEQVLGKCPVCGNNTTINKISCSECGTVIEGNFELCKFCRLTAEQKKFIEIFIKCRGNIKEVEKEMKISYPTVKNKLEDAAFALGYKGSYEATEGPSQKEIIDRLNKGEITVDEALSLLKE